MPKYNWKSGLKTGQKQGSVGIKMFYKDNKSVWEKPRKFDPLFIA
jgi:hypothetical protein